MKISPCPFCGYQMTKVDLEDALHPINASPERLWVLNCLELAGGCGFSMVGKTKEQVVDKWNKRKIISD